MSEIDELRAATGGLPSTLVVKVLTFAAGFDYLELGSANFTVDEIESLQRAFIDVEREQPPSTC